MPPGITTDPTSLLSTLKHWFPTQSDLSGKSLLLAATAALAALTLVALVCRHFLNGLTTPFLIASMGASAMLLFVVPSSPMSRPWPFAGGHLVSAFIGISCAKLIPDLALAAAFAGAGAIVAMYLLRCMHPPGGASALLTVVGGNAIHAMGYQFLLTPLALNVAIMLGCALLFWRFALTAHTPISRLDERWQRSEEKWLSTTGPAFTDHDLDRALEEMDTFLDISRDDLNEIYARARQHAHRRQLGTLRCGEAMSDPVVWVEFGTPLEECWQLMERHEIHGLPVVDRAAHVIGIVTVRDFVHHANQLEHETLAERLAHLRRRTQLLESDKPEVAGQIMTSPVLTVDEAQPVSEIAPLFTANHIHHIPVVDPQQKLVGMLTREDIMAACDCPPEDGH